jgi:radical SAM protein with 4Fe4S-binding SPASM domain
MELSEQGVPFRSTMTSNGYLIDADMVQRAKNLWQLQKVQITLDGTAQTYNRVKAYVYQGVNAFERVLENIGQLIAVGIRVVIRLNVDKHNIGEMAELAELLHQHFGSNEHLSVYSHELFGERTPEDNATLFAQRMQLEQQIAKHGILRIKELPKDILLNQCMADNDQSVMIAPDGHLGKCEHFIDREFFGHIDSEERDMAIIRKFKERQADIEACTICPFYPLCNSLVMCPNHNICSPEIQQMTMHKTTEAMKYEYECYLNKKEN